ncbi:MAG: winged helix-turn-helix transcriptional regulator [archaeon]
MKTHEKILNELRTNSRTAITEISRKLGISKTTTYSQFIYVNKTFIKRFITLLNFPKIGYLTRVVFFLKINSLKNIDTTHINSITQLHGKHNILLECLFKDNEEAIKYAETLKKHKPKIYHLVETVCEEEFLLK